MRAVLDPNVLISGLLSSTGAPAQALARWRAGDFDLVVSEALLDELARALGYGRLRKRVTPAEAAAFVDLLRRAAVVAPQPGAGTYQSSDPDDDYLLALAERERALLVTGDTDLLAIAENVPVVTPRTLVDGL